MAVAAADFSGGSWKVVNGIEFLAMMAVAP